VTLPYRQSHLYRWRCPDCTLIIRSRLYDKTFNEAKWHLWTKHRSGITTLPSECLWDTRMVGTDVLYTWDIPGEL